MLIFYKSTGGENVGERAFSWRNIMGTEREGFMFCIRVEEKIVL